MIMNLDFPCLKAVKIRGGMGSGFGVCFQLH